MRLNLWSSPRNISTALMYAFAQRPDTKIVDEPLYAHYLRHQPTQAQHPGKAEILASMENDGELVVKQLLSQDYGKALVVFKQMTHHLVHLSLASEVAILGLSSPSSPRIGNVLLIRDPRAILASFSKVIEEVTAEDIGLPQQYALFKRLQAAGKLTAVLDSRRLLLDPAAVLKQLSDAVDLPFYPEMLHWPASPRPEDGCWAKYWYANVHRSTGFQAYQEKHYQLTPPLQRIADDVMPLYQEMLEHAL